VPPAEVFELISVPDQDPVAQADQRESLRRLIADVRRLPDQQRSALLMRELSGMSYAELAEALETTVPAVKSLLVRARMALALSVEARDTACADIRDELVLAQDRRVRPNAMARRHMRDCPGCREFRHELRGVSRQLAALAPAIGPIGIAAKLLGFGFGSSAGGGAAMGGGTAAGGGAAMGGGTAAAGGATVGLAGTGGALASAGALATGAGHVATLLVATVVTAGGAVEIQHTIAPVPAHHRPTHHAGPHHYVPSAPPVTPSLLPAAYVAAPPVAPAAATFDAASVPVLHRALTAPPPQAPPPPTKPAAANHPAKNARPGKVAAIEIPTPSTPTADGATSTSTGTPDAPIVTSTSMAGPESTTSTSDGSSTSTGANPDQSLAASTSTSSGTTQSASSTGPSGSSSTSTAGGTASGTSVGASEPTPPSK
jgi:hypothetical protein